MEELKPIKPLNIASIEELNTLGSVEINNCIDKRGAECDPIPSPQMCMECYLLHGDPCSGCYNFRGSQCGEECMAWNDTYICGACSGNADCGGCIAAFN